MSRSEEKAVLLRRRGIGLVAADDLALEVLQKIEANKDVLVWLKRSRNPAHHRKFMALVKLIFDNQTKYASREALLTAIKIGVGHCDFYQVGEKSAFVPRSLAFEAMDQTEFERFYDAVVQVVTSQIIPGLKPGELRRQLEEFVR